MFGERVVAVTGGANGIGAAICEAFVERGSAVAILDVMTADMSARVELLRSRGGRAEGFVLDVRDAMQWTRVLDDVRRVLGRLDVLVNCAGVTHPARADLLSDKKLMHVLQVNLAGAIHGTRSALRIFRKQDSGHIVNIASLGGLAAIPGEAVYAASKFGIRGYTIAVALELTGTNVRAHLVSPDSVETNMLRYEQRFDESMLGVTGNILQPEDVAEAVLRAIERDRVEVCVPRSRGWQAKLACVAPGLFRSLWPRLAKQGAAALALRRAQQATAAVPAYLDIADE